MKRVLFVTSCNPFVYGGGAQATRAYMDATIDIFGKEKLDIIIPAESKIPDDYIGCNFILAPERPLWKSIPLLLAGVTGRQEVLATNIIKEHKNDYSLCVYNGWDAGYCFKRIKDLNIKKVVIHHNEEVEYCMTTKHFATFYGYWPNLVKKVQKWAYKYADANFFLTKQDMEAFRQLYGSTNANSRVIGTFDIKETPIIIPQKEKKDYSIVLSGSMADYQTEHGITDFYNHYFDITMKLIQNVRILLTGRNPSTKILRLEQVHPDYFTIIPNPEDIMSQVRRGQIFLNPTNIGGGLKLRNMDGLRAGLPVLTHEISARGYDYYSDKPYFKIYNNEDSFEKGLRDIINFLDKTPDSHELIIRDYYDYFGYQRGVDRMKAGLGNEKTKS